MGGTILFPLVDSWKEQFFYFFAVLIFIIIDTNTTTTTTIIIHTRGFVTPNNFCCR